MTEGVERHYQSALAAKLKEVGTSHAVDRFLSKYSNIRTKAVYACELVLYLRWLKQEKGIGSSPDELVKDNLVCIFKSDAIDVVTKRKHTDFYKTWRKA